MDFPAEALKGNDQPGAHERGFTASGGADNRQEAGRSIRGEIRNPLRQMRRKGFAAKEKVCIRLVKKQKPLVWGKARRGRILLPRRTGQFQ